VAATPADLPCQVPQAVKAVKELSRVVVLPNMAAEVVEAPT